MANIFNDDFREFITLLNENKVEYILVGGYSVILHGYPRSTGDMDIWVNPSHDNFLKLKKSFFDFGLPIMDEQEFLNHHTDVFSYGKPPLAIDILTKCKGLDFEECITQAKIVNVEDFNVNLIAYNHLIQAKKASGRHKDLNDLEHL